jgi:protein NrfD
MEEVLATAHFNPMIDPSLAIWDWRIAVYLFLGGLTAGVMCFSAWAVLRDKGREAPFTAWRLALWGPVLLSLGMTTLFLDLEHKLYVLRFYTTFRPSSPMSYGAWILIFVYPAAIALILGTLRQGYPLLASWLERLPRGGWLMDTAEAHRRAIAVGNIPLGIALGIYTGILLSGFMARPFWNSAILGPLFLVSGLSTAAALVVVLARETAERRLFTRIDVGLILAELGIVALLLIGLATGARMQQEALATLLGGSDTLAFWLWFVSLGLVLPLALEGWELRGGHVRWALLAPVLVLAGGFILRQVALDVGLEVNWTHFATQFDPALLQRLHP